MPAVLLLTPCSINSFWGLSWYHKVEDWVCSKLVFNRLIEEKLKKTGKVSAPVRLEVAAMKSFFETVTKCCGYCQSPSVAYFLFTYPFPLCGAGDWSQDLLHTKKLCYYQALLFIVKLSPGCSWAALFLLILFLWTVLCFLCFLLFCLFYFFEAWPLTLFGCSGASCNSGWVQLPWVQLTCWIFILSVLTVCIWEWYHLFADFSGYNKPWPLLMTSLRDFWIFFSPFSHKTSWHLHQDPLN